MNGQNEDLCANCQRPLALYASHGCGDGADQCGARDAGCWDCVLECCQQTISLLRTDLERYKRKFGVLRPGLGDAREKARSNKGKKSKRPGQPRLPRFTVSPYRAPGRP